MRHWRPGDGSDKNRVGESYVHAGNVGQVGVRVADGLQKGTITRKKITPQWGRQCGHDLQEKSQFGGASLLCVDVFFAGIRSKGIVNFCCFGPIKEKFGFAELSGEQFRARQLDKRKGLSDEEESSDEEA
jgi:hypothetical protein